ncbi:MAG: hypothetical protein WCQ57_04800 [Verrucomicrobiota bacterium]
MMQRKTSPAGQLVGLMLLSVFALALTGLFGIWYSHKNTDDALTHVGELTRLIDGSRKAQIEFKVQVQHWKNLLLRGQNPEDLATYTKRFEEQNQVVQKALAGVLASPELPAELRPELESITAEHGGLLVKYQAAAAPYSSSDPATIFAVDRSVRGIDQKLNERIDQLAGQLVALEARRLAELRAADEKLYRDLRLVILIVSGVAVACAGALAWRSLSVRP